MENENRSYVVEKYGARFFGVYECMPNKKAERVCVTVYRKGANEVKSRLEKAQGGPK
jgi:hypothetical protein